MKLAKPSRCKGSPELEGIGQEHTAFHLIEQVRLQPRLCSHMLRKHSAGSMKRVTMTRGSNWNSRWSQTKWTPQVSEAPLAERASEIRERAEELEEVEQGHQHGCERRGPVSRQLPREPAPARALCGKDVSSTMCPNSSTRLHLQ